MENITIPTVEYIELLEDYIKRRYFSPTINEQLLKAEYEQKLVNARRHLI